MLPRLWPAMLAEKRETSIPQHEDGGGDGLRRQGPPIQSPFPPDVLASPRRAGRLHAGGVGERPSREPGRAGLRALLQAAASVQGLRRPERLARRQMPRLGQGARPSRRERANDLGRVRGQAPEAHSRSLPLRWIPRAARFGVEDLPRAVRQQPVFGQRKRRRSPGRHSCLRRPHRHPPGRAIVAEHKRAFGRGHTVYDPWHYVPVQARKPGVLRNGAPFKDWVLPAALDRIRRKLAGSDDADPGSLLEMGIHRWDLTLRSAAHPPRPPWPTAEFSRRPISRICGIRVRAFP